MGGGLASEWMGEVEDENRGGRAKQNKRAGNVGKGKERKGTKQGEARGMRLPNRYELNNKFCLRFLNEPF